MRGLLKWFTSLHDRGDVVKVRLGLRPAYVVCDPAALHQVLQDPVTFDKGGVFYDKVRGVFGNGLASCALVDHRRQRPLVQPAFARNRMTTYTEVIGQEVDAVASGWQPGQVLDLKSEMNKLAIRITGRTLFSTDLGADAIARVQEAIPVIVTGLGRQMIDPTGLIEKLPLRSNRRFAEAVRSYTAVVDDAILRYREDGRDHGDLLSMLLGMEDHELHEQILTLITAASETTATALSWTLHLLSTHPDVEERLHDEISESGHAYTRRVITESLRMYPPGWIVTRSTTCDVELGGVRIPANSMIVVSPYLIHHRPGVFDEPSRFDPDRWLPERVTPAQRQAFVAFGGGVRKCIGDVFALNAAQVAVTGICRRWRLRPVPGQQTEILLRSVMWPSELRMVPTARAA